MTQAQHTPGPWTVEKCLCGHPACRAYGTSNGNFVQGTGYSLEDATLIAAAPAMLAALEAAESVLGEDPDAWVDESEMFAAQLLAVKQVRAAIAAATGDAAP